MHHSMTNPFSITQRPRGTQAPIALATVIAMSFAGLAQAQSATGWGRNNFGQTNVPAGLNSISRMDGGLDHTVALLNDGSVAAWGWNFWGQCDVPAGMGVIRAAAAGDWHSVAVNTDGQVFCWGDNFNGQCDIPPEAIGVSAVAAGYQFTSALLSGGTVVCWGRNVEGQCNVPAGLDRVVRIASGADHTVALRSDGTVVCWGRGDSGQTTVPVGLGPVKDVSAGHMHSIALQTDGTVVAWGNNFYGQRTVPAGVSGVIAIAAGGYHNVVLNSSGAVQAWGAGQTNTGSGGNFGQSIVPTTISNVIDVDAGEYYSLALSKAGGVVAPSITVVSTTDSSCSGAGGAIDVTIANAETVFWTGPAGFFSNSIDLTGLAGGTYTATAIGVGGTATRNIVIVGGVDATAPVVTSFEAAKSAAVGANCTALVPDFTATVVATDNCTPTAQLVVTQSPAAGASRPIGSHTVVITVTDLAGNAAAVNATFSATGTEYTYYTDADADLYGTTPTTTSCSASVPAGFATQSGDCNDANPLVNPGRTEICNAIDDNCNGLVDDGLATNTYFVDADDDGFGLRGSTGIVACAHPAGTATNALDCNDQNAAINPLALEVCDPANVDENCNTLADDLDPTTVGSSKSAFYRDADQDTYTVSTPTRFCDMPAGYETAPEGDCNDAAAAVYPGAIENCANDGIDNDCDGEANSDAEAVDSVAYYADSDSDSFGAGSATMSCTAIAGRVTNNLDCDDTRLLYRDNDLDTYGAGAPVACGVVSNTDCNDAAATVYPGAVENCANDGTDNDCDGEANSDAEAIDSVSYYTDADQDGFGTGTATKSCTAIAGRVTNNSDCDDTRVLYRDGDLDTFGAGAPAACGVVTSTDCDDAAATVYPGAVENCANDGIDNNCDGEANADFEAVDATAYYRDLDVDGFGAATSTAILSCTPLTGRVPNNSDCDDTRVMYRDADADTFGAGAMIACNGVATNTDCNDSAADVYPGAVENCANDGTDNDCDGEANADAEAIDSVSYFRDADADGFGAGAATKSCTAIAGSVTNSADCDDARVMYADGDADTFGAGPMIACNGVATNTDCNDASAAVYPGAVENCANDGTDNDCDGEANSDAEAIDSVSYFRDADSDGFGAGAATKSCTAIAGSVTDSSDCDDTRVMYADGDADTFGAGPMIACNGVATNTDCNDAAADVHPGAAEVCANRAVDNDCDGIANDDAEATDSVAYYTDGDRDGFGAGAATMSCVVLVGKVTNNADCDDTKLLYADNDGDLFGAGALIACGGVTNNIDCDDAAASVHPGAAELCANAGIDNDCDGIANDDAEATDSVSYYRDADGDGFGAGTVQKSCTPPAGWVTNSTDCDDAAVMYADIDRDGFGAGPKVACDGVALNTDCDDASASVHPGAPELCANDGIDNDCDGEANSDAEASDSVAYFVDADQDGFGAGASTMSCTAIAGSVTNSTDCDDAAVMYTDADHDTFGALPKVACNGVSSSSDCNDASATVFPGAPERCANDGIDNDCDGEANSDAEATDSVAYFVDGDSDGFGAGASTMSCTAIAGSVTNSTDCNDASASVHPGAPELCANDGIDNDCDGEANSDAEATDSVAYFVDGDHDGFGAGSATMSCTAIAGSVTNNSDCNDAAVMYTDADHDTYGTLPMVACDGVSSNTDCNDASATVNPGAQEFCNSVDDNCNGSVDDGITFLDYYPDVDLDGFGDASASAERACQPVAGKVLSHNDCNDGRADIHPGAVETCANDGTDNDCDGEANSDAEATDSVAYFVDADNDGFGAGSATMSCTAIAGSVTNGSDCNDAAVLYADADGDLFGAGPMVACNGVTVNGDCNDSAATVFPGAPELCANDGTDNDCDGEANSDAEATDSVAYFVDADHDGFGAGSPTMSCTAIAGSVTNGSDCNDAAVLYADADGDLFGAGPMVACNGVTANGDCNDSAATVFPGAPELCANDGTDNDCDGEANSDAEATDSVAYFVDADQDGFGAGAPTMSCTAIAGSVTNSTDCDDTKLLYADNDLDTHGAGSAVACGVASNDDCNDAAADIFPGASEVCANRAVDNDCDGDTSDAEASDSVSYFVDGDQDGFGAGPATKSCVPISGSVTNSSDCDDAKVLFVDADQDGFGAGAPAACGVANRDDCDDASASVHPGAPERCANDGIDNDCDGEANSDAEATDSVAYFVDADHDGFGAGGATMSCTAIAGSVTNSTDCNDASATTHPGAEETCNSTDDDCNGAVDDGVVFHDYFRDADGDGFGSSADAGTSACSPIAGSVLNNLDCDDSNAAIKPSAAELCNAIDDNCNGAADDGLTFVDYYLDADQDGFGRSNSTAQNACAPVAGRVANNLDCDDSNASIKPGAAELCDLIDQNCNGQVDEGLPTQNYYADADQDSFGAASGTPVASCMPIAGRVLDHTDCDDASAAIHPGAPELCANDGIDNDCDGEANSDAEAADSVAYYRDADGDTFGWGSATMSCTAVSGWVIDHTDCDDASASVHPGAPELCANDGIDNDCDGEANSDAEATDSVAYYRDADNDGFGFGAPTLSCTTIAGSVTNHSDCDDAAILYSDADLDTFGALPLVACGGVASNTDCDDASAAIHPGAPELCANDGIDNDCDGEANADTESTDAIAYCFDNDHDGFGAGVETRWCAAPEGCVANNTDCNDSDATIYPGAPELCDALDNNCAGDIDEGLQAQTWYRDADGDGFGDPAQSMYACGQPAGFVGNAADRCVSDPNKRDPGVCGCGSPDSDIDSDGRIDCIDIALAMTETPDQIVAGAPYTVRLYAETITPILQVTGAQFALKFDATRLELLDVVPVVESPFSLEIGQDINNTLGTLRYALGVSDSETGFAGSSDPNAPVARYDFVDLVFVVRPNADTCARNVQLVRFESVGSWKNIFATASGLGMLPSLASLPFEDLDETAPVLTGVPANMAMAADAGTVLGAFVPAPSVSAADTCTNPVALEFSITYPNGSSATAWPANGMFPIGTSTLSWRAIDETGNETFVTRTIAVANHQLLDIAVSTDSFTVTERTVQVRLTTGAASQLVSVVMPRWTGSTPSVGIVRDVQVPVAAGYDCISAKDILHSLSGVDMPGIVGRKYEAAFTIVQGDSNDDNRIDITDFSIFVADRSVAANFNRAADARSNFNADNRVDNVDFGNISINFFRRGDSCAAGFDGEEPLARISVKELRRRGMGELTVADLNGDGWVDMRDVQAYMNGGSSGSAPAVPGVPTDSGW